MEYKINAEVMAKAKQYLPLGRLNLSSQEMVDYLQNCLQPILNAQPIKEEVKAEIVPEHEKKEKK